MKRFLSTILFTLCAFVMMAQTPEQRMLQGNAAYRNAHYQAAVKAYTEVLDDGFVSADLYYNLGNAYYRLDELGQAILYYERALRLRPNFRDARENLELAQSKTEDRISPLPELFIVQWARAVVNLFSTTGWRIVLLLFLLITGAAVVCFFVGNNYRLRKASLIGGSITLVLTLLCIVCCISSIRYANAHDSAIVTQPLAVIKSSPEQEGMDKYVLHEGTRLKLNEEVGDWYKVTLPDGNSGWAEATDITVI